MNDDGELDRILDEALAETCPASDAIAVTPHRRAVALGFAAAAVTSIPAHATASLTMGQVNLTFYAAAGGVVEGVLGRLGHAVSKIDASHTEIYRRLGAGEADLLVASWLPNAHGPLHAPLADGLVEAATLYDEALLYWSVPAHVPAELVAGIGDLKKPDVLSRMDRDIVAVGPGSGLARGSETILTRYGLDDHGYRLRIASPAEWAERLATATRERRWIVMPLWRPQYLNALFAPRPLLDPLSVFKPDRCVLVFRRDAWLGLTDRSRSVIQRIALDIPSVTELDRLIAVDGVHPRTAGETWLSANPHRVSAWFAGP